MFRYSIVGEITYNEAETESGFVTTKISEEVSVEEMSAECAMSSFLAINEQYQFFGTLKNCDAETRGGRWAVFRDQNEDQTIAVDLVGG